MILPGVVVGIGVVVVVVVVVRLVVGHGAVLQRVC